MGNLVCKAIKYKHIILFIVVLILAFGMMAYYFIPKQENPASSVAVAMITTVYPGASPDEVEGMVTAKLEDAVSAMPDIDSISSVSMNSASVIIVFFDVDTQWDSAKTELITIVSQAKSELPELAFESEVQTQMTEQCHFILALSGGDYSREDLAEYGLKIKKAVEKIDGVNRIDVEGLLERQVSVVIDVNKLDLYNISIEDVLNLMQAQNLSIPSGSIEYDTGRINVNTPATFSNLKDIENLVIGGSQESVGFVTLKDIATISIDYKDGYSYKQDGNNSILLSGYFDTEMNAVLIGDEVREVIAEVKGSLPDDIIFHDVMFSPQDIDNSVTAFIFSLIQSIMLIVIVVMVGVKLKNGIVVSFALPISIMVTFIVMYLLKIEFQFISIAALIISLGILVDNAIVISESIQQKLDDGIEKMESIRLAVGETAIPILTSTITTIITFGILYFLPGTIGQIVSTIPTVVITALLASYIVAMLVIPVLASMFFTPPHVDVKQKRNIKIMRKNRIMRFFLRLTKIGLMRPKSTIFVAFLLLGISIVLVMQLGMSFFPYSDKPVFYLNIYNETMNIESTMDITEKVEDILSDNPVVTNYTTSVGKGLPRFFLTVPTYAPADNYAQIMIQVDFEGQEEYMSTEDVGIALQQAFDSNITGANIEVRYLEYSMPIDAKIVLKITGDDMTEIKKAADTAQAGLMQIEGTRNVRDDYVQPSYEYLVDLNSDLLSTMGIIKYDVVKQINTALMGAETSKYLSGGSELDIVVSANVQSLDDLYKLPIKSSIVDSQVYLEQIADVSIDTSIPTINRYNKEKVLTVLADLEEGYSAISIEREFQQLYADDIESGDIGIEYVGEVKNIMDLLGNLGPIVAVALVLMYLVLLAQFNSFKKPLIVLTSIPLSLIGSFIGLYLMQADLQAMSLLGITSLFGIVVNNGIILVEFIDAEDDGKSSIVSACLRAVSMRYKPILLSATTTCIGLVPLIMSGDPMSAPMALVLFFGLLFSTILTMVVVPVMYSMLCYKKWHKSLEANIEDKEIIHSDNR